MLANIAGMSSQEWLMLLIPSAGVALVGIRAIFGSTQRARRGGRAWRQS
jgi:hypothetical protein